MSALIIRLTALCACALLALIASFQIETAESSIPAGAERTVDLSVGTSPLSKPELIAALNRVSDDEDLVLEKIVVDPGDYLHGRSLYRFGEAHPIGETEISWYSPSMHGTRLPASELGVASLDGSYALSGTDNGVAALVEWARSQNIGVVVHDPARGLARLAGAVSQSGTAAALIAVALLMFAAVLTWHAVRARGRTLKMMAGVRSGRLLAEETGRLGGLLCGPVILVAIVACAVVSVRSGTGYLGEYVGFLLPMLVALVGVTVLVSFLISAFAEPSVAFIASRQPPIRRFRGAGEVGKIAILITSLVCIPLALSSVLDSAALTRDAERWVNLRETLSINGFGTEPGSADEATTDDAFRRVVAAADARSELALSYTMPPMQDESGSTDAIDGFEAVVMVNPHFLELMGTRKTDLIRVAPEELNARDTDNLGAELSLQTNAPQNWDPATFAPFELYRIPEGTELSVIGFEDSPRMQRYTAPLVVLDHAPGVDLAPSFLAAATSQDGVLFGNREHLIADLADHGLADRATSIDRAADAGLLRLQISTRTMYFNVVAVILLLGALAFGSWLAATSYVLAHARRLVPMRTGGLSWARIFRTRVLTELAMAGGLTLVTALTFAVLAVPGTLWWAILVPVGYMALSIAFHLRAGRQVFAQRIARRD